MCRKKIKFHGCLLKFEKKSEGPYETKENANSGWNFATFLKITVFSSQCSQTNLKTHYVSHFVLEKIKFWWRNHHFFKTISCLPVRPWEVPFWPIFGLIFRDLLSLATGRPDFLQMQQQAWFPMPKKSICLGGHQNSEKIKLGVLWEQKGWIFGWNFATFFNLAVFSS